MEEINNFIGKLKSYFVTYQPFIFYSLILLGLLLFFSSLPYVNLFLAEDSLIVFILTVFWFINVILFKPAFQISFILAIIFCLPAYLLLLIGLGSLAEIAGDAIFVLFVTGGLQMIIFQVKKKQIE